MILIAVMFAGAIGAVCRFTMDTFICRLLGITYSAGTYFVNVTGSLGAGLVVGIATSADVQLPEMWAVALLTGFLSSYTTFSSWMVQNVQLMQNGQSKVAVISMASHFMSGLMAALLGLWLAGLLI